MLNIIIVFLCDIKAIKKYFVCVKITNVSNKKQVVLSVILSNASVTDILVIVIFSSIISNQVNTSNFVVGILWKINIIPFLVILRFLFYIEK